MSAVLQLRAADAVSGLAHDEANDQAEDNHAKADVEPEPAGNDETNAGNQGTSHHDQYAGPGGGGVAVADGLVVDAGVCLGHYNLDPDVRFFATPPVDGTFAEYVVHPAAFAHPVPEGLSDDAAALLEPLSVALAARAAGEVQLGDRVLIAGAGPIGLLVSAVCALAGADVTITDVRAERLQSAPRYGASRTFTAADAPEMAPEYQVFIDATGAERAVLSGMQRLAPRGRCVLVGMGADTIALPVPLVQGRELRITGTFRYANTWPLAISIAEKGLVDLDGLVTSRHGLDDVEAALVAGAREGALKAVVTP